MESAICHSGIKGMKWYHRRYQYQDGSLTPEGRKRYGVNDPRKKHFFEKKKNPSEMSEEEVAAIKKVAARTPEGVRKNKDLFTTAELKELNERFKVEDELYSREQTRSNAKSENESKNLQRYSQDIQNQNLIGMNIKNMDRRAFESERNKLGSHGSNKEILSNLHKYDDQDIDNLSKRLKVRSDLESAVKKQAEKDRLAPYAKKKEEYAKSRRQFYKHLNLYTMDEIEEITKRYKAEDDAHQYIINGMKRASNYMDAVDQAFGGPIKNGLMSLKKKGIK